MKRHIAVDIGASSGRLILGYLDQGTLQMEEIHRFENKMTQDGEHFFWDIEHLFEEIVAGLIKIEADRDGNKHIDSIGVDTWAVDYVLINAEGQRVAPVYAYRDHRTDQTMEKVFSQMEKQIVYEKTGIQFLQFNSIYQLFEHVRATKEDFDNASSFLMVPDYLNYLLSGKRSIEYTNATSTQLLDAASCTWDTELLELVGTDASLFCEVTQPGTILGELTKDLAIKTGLIGTRIIAPATHDTGSAVVSVPATQKGFAYISSGTWSLMGIESDHPICTKEALKYNFTNEGGVFGTYRVLKNIMGLWIIQEVKRLYHETISFADLVINAQAAEPFYCLLDPNDSRFLNPANMIEEIKSYCQETQQGVPQTIGQLARCVFESLAFAYRNVLEELKEIHVEPIESIYIIGGGAKNSFLNQLCADFTGCKVFAGPFEATAIGNLAMQMISLGSIASLTEARKIIKDSFDIEVYTRSALAQAQAQTEATSTSDQSIEENWIKFRRLCHGN